MRPYPVRLPDSLIDDLDEEADERDLGTAEYIRNILRRRDSTQKDTQDHTQPNTQEYTDRLDEHDERIHALQTRVRDLEERVAAAEQAESDERDQRDGQTEESPQRSVSGAERRADAGGSSSVDESTDSVRAKAEKAVEAADIAGSGNVQRNRREALLWAWDYLRQEGKAQSSQIANATYGAFWDDDLGYGVQTRYPGRGLWQGYLREELAKLPNVDDPPQRGRTWEFVDTAMFHSSTQSSISHPSGYTGKCCGMSRVSRAVPGNPLLSDNDAFARPLRDS